MSHLFYLIEEAMALRNLNKNNKRGNVPIVSRNILDLQELELVAQLIDNMEVVVEKVERAYADKNGAEFKESKEEMLKFQKKIQEILV